MHLSDFDLQQLDEAKLSALTAAQKDALLVKLWQDLKEARERLRQDSQTSSRPPSSDPPWSSAGPVQVVEEEGVGNGLPEAGPSEAEPTPEDPCFDTSAVSSPPRAEPKRPGRPPGAAGHSRQVKLPVSATVVHRPPHCVVCGRGLEHARWVARTGLYVLDVVSTEAEGLQGLQVSHEKHVYGESRCECGHWNRSEPGRCGQEPLWTVALSEWQLVGPLLASLIVCLGLRLRLSRRHIQEFLRDWLGIALSTGTITHCIHEAGRAVEPLEEPLVEELQRAVIAYADETPWKEWGRLLWLWVFTTPTLCLYWIGYRSRELLDNVLGEAFEGWLMSDGYGAYRHFAKRLRCWAHLARKAQGLAVSLTGEARAFGAQVLGVLRELRQAVYRARAGPTLDLQVVYASRLQAFRQVCEQHRDSAHEKTRELAREFLNDWEAIWRVLAQPHLPLTNNEAERALRPWVLARRISQGTRTEQGSRALALLASVIETCRKRGILPWPYLAQVIAQRRKGQPPPPFPASIA
jgi:transposase